MCTKGTHTVYAEEWVINCLRDKGVTGELSCKEPRYADDRNNFAKMEMSFPSLQGSERYSMPMRLWRAKGWNHVRCQ